MTLLERYLNYLSQICEGSRTPPEGILLTRTGDMEKAIELQQQIAGLGIPAAPRRTEKKFPSRSWKALMRRRCSLR